MRKLEILAGGSGMLLNVLAKGFPLVPEYAFRLALKKKDIKVNGIRVSENIKVMAGDALTVFTDVMDREIPIVYEDQDWLLVNKPAGMNTDRNVKTSLSLLDWAISRNQSEAEPVLVHRLDNRTSGLVLLAKGDNNAENIKKMLRLGQISKTYICLVLGKPQPAEQICHAWLSKDAKQARVTISHNQSQGAKEICTGYRIMEAGAVSRLEVRLFTGRTHQIRAHMAFLGHPVIGDEVYGNRKVNQRLSANRLMLCASGLSFPKNPLLNSLSGQSFHITPPF